MEQHWGVCRERGLWSMGCIGDGGCRGWGSNGERGYVRWRLKGWGTAGNGGLVSEPQRSISMSPRHHVPTSDPRALQFGAPRGVHTSGPGAVPLSWRCLCRDSRGGFWSGSEAGTWACGNLFCPGSRRVSGLFVCKQPQITQCAA